METESGKAFVEIVEYVAPIIDRVANVLIIAGVAVCLVSFLILRYAGKIIDRLDKWSRTR